MAQRGKSVFHFKVPSNVAWLSVPITMSPRSAERYCLLEKLICPAWFRTAKEAIGTQSRHRCRTGHGPASARHRKRTLGDKHPTSLAIHPKDKSIGLTGIEPALPKELDPKSSASASSATAPHWNANKMFVGKKMTGASGAVEAPVASSPKERGNSPLGDAFQQFQFLTHWQFRGFTYFVNDSSPVTVGTTQTLTLASTSL